MYVSRAATVRLNAASAQNRSVLFPMSKYPLKHFVNYAPSDDQGCRFAPIFRMSFLRHLEIYPSDGDVDFPANGPAHRLDEFPAGYSLAGCSPAEPASASPTAFEYAVRSSCRARQFHRTANCVLTVCVSRGDKRNSSVVFRGVRKHAKHFTSVL
jgi:hypothetical protein